MSLRRQVEESDKKTVHSTLAVPTRWILGIPRFHPMVKFVWESLIAKELKLGQRGAQNIPRFPHRSTTRLVDAGSINFEGLTSCSQNHQVGTNSLCDLCEIFTVVS